MIIWSLMMPLMILSCLSWFFYNSLAGSSINNSTISLPTVMVDPLVATHADNNVARVTNSNIENVTGMFMLIRILLLILWTRIMLRMWLILQLIRLKILLFLVTNHILEDLHRNISLMCFQRIIIVICWLIAILLKTLLHIILLIKCCLMRIWLILIVFFCAMFLQSLSLHIFIKQSNLNLGEILWMKRLMQWSEQILGVFFLFSMALLINIRLTWLQRDIVSNKVLILLLPFHLLLRLWLIKFLSLLQLHLDGLFVKFSLSFTALEILFPWLHSLVSPPHLWA